MIINNNINRLLRQQYSSLLSRLFVNNDGASRRRSLSSTTSKSGLHVHSPLSQSDIDHFDKYGYLVKPALLDGDNNKELMNAHQKELRTYLTKNANVDFGSTSVGSPDEAALLATQENKMAAVSNGFGGMINYYHGNAMYKIRQHPALYHSFVQLYRSTYSTGLAYPESEWPNEYGYFNPAHMFMFINRCGFRIPTPMTPYSNSQATVQKGTGVHLDCNPYQLFRGQRLSSDHQKIENVPLRFWQPIQAFVALSDTLNEGEGGFWCVPSFHKQCVNYFKQVEQPVSNASQYVTLKRGNAFDLHNEIAAHNQVIRQLVHIPVRRGDIVFWDWRLPHCNDAVHHGEVVREVVYAAHLPAVSVNNLYARKQIDWFNTGVHPSYVSKQFATLEMNEYRRPDIDNPLGRKLLGIESW
ncbi:hypothetical protein SAMD00019534_047550 [Acytostelium subglobosum LB1]|uniref:hypothetical protein n=1 Tax=Acytostelium subglobosum LB1 TaxID=1410327 RepID=UPI0006449915|nr:hypothetical protein SAMD00019534_047550 [Acytostelium subglobosum LB1]GAM21580.1 hypothetical protein SAMD00019534_047550 [Acytostelium subglobosum LB1]|eukprot:XP_012755699.1 hypothetical protein SAMD00019534_047550 [Acytostelium subglobosum LB1]